MGIALGFVCGGGFLPRIFMDLGTEFHRLLRGWGRFVKRVTISLSESGRRLFSGCAAVSRHHLMVMRLFGNFIAVIRRRCDTVSLSVSGGGL